MNNKKIVVIVGTTASNKSKLSLMIKESLKNKALIINADAFQVYKEISVGTNKLDAATIKKNNIKLMDNISIYDEWSIYNFQKESYALIKEAYDNDLIPIIVGGSNLYIDCLINGYSLETGNRRDDLFENCDTQSLYKKLLNLDENEARKIGANNRKRIVRALQIHNSLNIRKSEIKNNLQHEALVIHSVIADREILYKKINDAVDDMIANGWKNEVKSLIEKDRNITNLQALKAIGYKEVYDSIVNNEEIDIELIKMKTRRYAKRQLTWIRNKFNVVVYNQNNYQEIIDHIESFINGK